MPKSTDRTRRGPSPFAVIAVLVLPLVFIVPAVYLLVQGQLGTRVDATIKHCAVQSSGRGYAETCTANWTVDGHRIEGDIEGATSSDVGDTVSARLHGDTAYTASLDLPLLLLALGVPCLWLTYRWVKNQRAITGLESSAADETT